MNTLYKLLNDLSSSKAAVILFIIGFLIFGNSLNNGFIADDLIQVSKNPTIQSLNNLGSIFKGTHNETVGQSNNYYRPFLYTTYSVIYSVFTENIFGFHLIQVFLHICNAILIFLILKSFFNRGISFILSVLFLVHPINVETVVYISNLQENLFLFFGLTALYLSQKTTKIVLRSLIISLLLLLTLLSKETGLVFLIIIPLFALLFPKKQFLAYLAACLLALGIYCFLRFSIANISINSIVVVPIMTLSLQERLMYIPKIIFTYIKSFLYPRDLIFFQDWTIKLLNFKDFYFPLIFDVILFGLLTVIGYFAYKKHTNIFKVYLFFLIWFIAGLGVHLQIIPLDQTVSDRWFYFPMIGLLGIAAVLVHLIKNRVWLKKIGFPAILLLLLIFSVRTVVRNTNWKDEFTLYSHDILLNKNSYQLHKGLGSIYNSRRDYVKAEYHLLQSTELFPSLLSYSGLGFFYLQHDKLHESVSAYNSALSHDANNAVAWSSLAIAKYKLGDRDGAIADAKKAYSIAPYKNFATILSVIENGGSINFRK